MPTIHAGSTREERIAQAAHNLRYKQTVRGALSLRIRRLKHRCKVAGVQCTLTHDDLIGLWNKQGGKCALSKEPLLLGSELANPMACSIDRVKPSLGYVPGNVRLVAFWINSARMAMQDDEFFDRVRRLSRNLLS